MAPLDPTTETLVRHARCGDASAYRQLLARRARVVLELVRRRMGPHLRAREESVDVAQSVLTDALRALDGFRGADEGALLRWLARIVENKLRKRARDLRVGDRDPGRRIVIEPARTETRGFELGSPTPTPSVEVNASDVRARVRAALAQLPERERRLIRLRQFEACSWPEVVQRSGEATVKAAQSAHARAFSHLEKLLSGHDELP